MDIKRFGVGPRMSQAVTYGGFVFLAGQVADEPAGKSVAEQTDSILAKIDALLAETGTDKSRILSTTIWLADIASFAEMNGRWDAWVSAGNSPARATVEAKLATPDYRVEIGVIAAAK